MIFFKLPKILLLLFALFSLSAQAEIQVDISPFLIKNYSDNFIKKFKISYDIEIIEKGEVINGKMVTKISNGKVITKFNQDWLGISTSAQMVLKNEKLSTNLLDLYDLKSKDLSYTIDLEDSEITKYEWNKKPKFMKSGQILSTGKSATKAANGKVVSIGEIFYKFSVLREGYEFCTIEHETELESKFKNVSADCDLFDKNKKFVGNKVEIVIAEQYTLKGLGTVEIEKD